MLKPKYITGRSAWDRLRETAKTGTRNRLQILTQWWYGPWGIGLHAPFQFATLSGVSGTCSCLTSIKSSKDGEEYAARSTLTAAIQEDALIPDSMSDLHQMTRVNFIEVWDHMVDCQEQMRNGKYPTLKGTWLDD